MVMTLADGFMIWFWDESSRRTTLLESSRRTTLLESVQETLDMLQLAPLVGLGYCLAP